MEEGYVPGIAVRVHLSPQQLDAMIARILNVTYENFTRTVSAAEIGRLCDDADDVLRAQPAFIQIQPPVNVCGDIHGQFDDLKRIFNRLGYPPARNYLFLGDIVDRGVQSLETIVLLLCYKVRYPTNFYVLRGNHECSNTNRVYGFLDEVLRRCGPQNAHLWKRFNQTFAWLPYVAMVGDRVLCMHGGISPDMVSLQQLHDLHRPYVDPPVPSLELDLLWADPAPRIRGTQPNPRGVSILFGADVILNVCKRLNIDLIVRAHQVAQRGAEFFEEANGHLMTIFSAPRYGRQNNIGAVLILEQIPNNIGGTLVYFT